MKDFPSYTFRVRNNETSCQGNATLPALVSYLQEAAWHNAADIGASVYVLMEKGVSWVMNRMSLEIIRIPRHLEEISVESWPSGKDRFFAYRDYEVFDKEGNVLVKATSAWVVFDIKARKLTPIPEWLSKLDPHIDRIAIPKWREKLRIPKTSTYQTPITTRWHDLDINQHVNNIRYFQWVVESLPLDFLESHTLKQIDIVLKAEARGGENLHSCAEPVDGTFLHKITNAEGKELIQARTTWVKKATDLTD